MNRKTLLTILLPLAFSAPAFAQLDASSTPTTVSVDAPEFRLVFDEAEGGDVTDFFNFLEDSTAPYTDKTSQSPTTFRSGLFHIGARNGASQPGVGVSDVDGVSDLQLLERTAARVRLRNDLDLGNGIRIVRDFSVYSSGKLYIHIDVTSDDTMWDFWDKLVGNDALFTSNYSSKTDRIAILSDNGPMSDLLDIWYGDYNIDGQNAWSSSWLDAQVAAGSGHIAAGFDSASNNAGVSAGSYESMQLVEFMRTDVTSNGNEWVPYADDYRTPAVLLMNEGSVWAEDGDGYNEAEGVYTIALPASQQFGFDISGPGLTRIRPSFKARHFQGVDTGAFSIDLNGATLAAGTDYVAEVKPFAEAWYDDGASPTQLADGGELSVASESLADAASAATLASFGVGRFLYLGSDTPFYGATFDLQTAGVGSILSWQYWNGSAWTSLSMGEVELGARDLHASGSIRFFEPDVTGWTPRTLTAAADGFDSERNLFWIRATPAASYSTAPVIREARTDLLLVHMLQDMSDNDTVGAMGPGACTSGGAEIGVLTVQEQPGSVLQFVWPASSDPCHASYRLYTHTEATDSGWPGGWTVATDLDGDDTNEQASYSPTAAPIEYFLVVDVTNSGDEGPAGHYGQ